MSIYDDVVIGFWASRMRCVLRALREGGMVACGSCFCVVTICTYNGLGD